MIYTLTIPNLISGFTENMALISTLNTLPATYFKYGKPCWNVYGTAPQAVLCGDRSVCEKKFVTYNQMGDMIHKYNNALGALIRVDCGSILYGCDKDIPIDRVSEVLLELSYNGSNQIEVSNENMYNHLISKFPNASFVGSKLMFSEDIISTFIRVVRLPGQLEDTLGIPKSKTEVVLNSPCDACPIEKMGSCVLDEHFRISTFEPSSIQDCRNFTTDIHRIPESNFDHYFDLGYRHFRFENFGRLWPRLFEDVIRAIIKPEYVDEVRLHLNLTMLNVRGIE